MNPWTGYFPQYLPLFPYDYHPSLVVPFRPTFSVALPRYVLFPSDCLCLLPPIITSIQTLSTLSQQYVTSNRESKLPTIVVRTNWVIGIAFVEDYVDVCKHVYRSDSYSGLSIPARVCLFLLSSFFPLSNSFLHPHPKHRPRRIMYAPNQPQNRAARWPPRHSSDQLYVKNR